MLSRIPFSRSCRPRLWKDRLLGATERSGQRCLSSTYYDSQSGLHLPVHDETEIRLFLDVRNREEPFVPQRLNKDRLEADEVSDALKELVQKGIHGLILPAIKFPRDLRNLHTLSVIAPPGFCVLTDSTNSETETVDDGLLRAKEASSSNTNFSKILDYRNDTSDLGESLQKATHKGLHTTVSVGPDIYDGDGDEVEPITLANNIASMIDSSGGCDYIWIKSDQTTTSSKDADTMVQICEELVYLDVAGATIKSRLLVDALNEDMVEDIVFAGVNKYVIDNEDQAQLVDDVANEQGKSLLRL